MAAKTEARAHHKTAALKGDTRFANRLFGVICEVMMTMTALFADRVARGLIHHDAAQEAVLEEFERIRSALKRPTKTGFFRKKPPLIQGLYLWGGVGRGKSMLMDLFVEAVGASGVSVRRVHFHAFMQEVHAALNAARKTGVEDAIAPVAKTLISQIKVLAFDEMQITDITDAMIVGRLFEALFEAGVVVVTTSNRRPDDLYKDGLNRALFLPFIDMLKERMVVWELVSPTDYRQNRLEGKKVYFTPINSETRAEVRKIFEDLAGGTSSPLIIPVSGRNLELAYFRNGVARASFYDLCGKPLGPADYLALAKTVRVLVLEDIPNLSRSNFNEAKRFVTLIDALYEARVRLICSAASEPEMLYLEGPGSFEFDRTASRLREMQAADWSR